MEQLPATGIGHVPLVEPADVTTGEAAAVAGDLEDRGVFLVCSPPLRFLGDFAFFLVCSPPLRLFADFLALISSCLC